MKLILPVNPHQNDRIMILWGNTIIQFVNDSNINVVLVKIWKTAWETYKNFEEACVKYWIGEHNEWEYDFTSLENKVTNE